MKLVIRAPNWVGDVVMATPVFSAARASERFESVTIVIREPLAGILADGPVAERARTIASDAHEA
jgi:ADP-heptose:LPS heptosyltransferase